MLPRNTESFMRLSYHSLVVHYYSHSSRRLGSSGSSSSLLVGESVRGAPLSVALVGAHEPVPELVAAEVVLATLHRVMVEVRLGATVDW